jgi:hypothetical protein
MQPAPHLGTQLPSAFSPQQPQLNAAWMNQMQHFSSGMSAMGFNPLLQQQLFQDALAMSQPVEAADEPLIVQALLSAKKKKESYKEALNNLHGVSPPTFPPAPLFFDIRDQRNGHSASLWKDYYLDHKDHIDTWINMCLEKEKSKYPPKTHDRRPPPHAVKRELSPARLPLSAPLPSKRRKHSSPSTSATPIPLAGRSTVNSLSVPHPVYNDQMPAPNSELKIPDPPSRSPSPPTRVIPQGRGNKYTEEDRQFFLRFISWRLKQDPSLTRNDLCNMLADKVPFSKSLHVSCSYFSSRPLIIVLCLGPLTGPTATIYPTRYLLLPEENLTSLMKTMTMTNQNSYDLQTAGLNIATPQQRMKTTTTMASLTNRRRGNRTIMMMTTTTTRPFVTTTRVKWARRVNLSLKLTSIWPRSMQPSMTAG